jgi:hypothetical protein
MYLRFTAALLALAAGAAGIVVVVLLLRSVPGPTSSASGPAAAARPELPGGRIPTDDPAFPSPPPGSLVLAQEAGRDALAIALAPGLVRVSVLGPSGDGASGIDVTLRFGQGYLQDTEACGAGCYQTELQGRPDSPVTVHLGGRSYRFDLPRGAAPDAAAIVSQAEATWNDLRTLVWHELLGSSPTNVIDTTYRAVAPDELSYTIAGRSAAVILGSSRWDRPAPGAPWRRSIQNPPLRQPQPFWQKAVDARLLGSGRAGGHAVWRVSFFDPSTPAWFEASIDKRTHRTLRLDMVAAAHFMHHRYGPFDAPLRLAPPT